METMFKQSIIEKLEGTADGVMTFVLYDDSVYDRDFEKVLVAGIDTANFMKNPVMLLQHNAHRTPIGRWENLRVEGTKLLADAVFDETTLDDDELVAIDKVKKGFLKAVSIGFMPTATPIKYYPEQGTPEAEALAVLRHRDCYHIYEKCELYEASIVTLPSNPNAVRIKSIDKAGATISAANKEILMECLKLCGDHQKAHGDTLKAAGRAHGETMKTIAGKLSKLIGMPEEPEEDEPEEPEEETEGFAAVKAINAKLDKIIDALTKDNVGEPDDSLPAETQEDEPEEPEEAEGVEFVELSLEELKSFLLSKNKERDDYDSR